MPLTLQLLPTSPGDTSQIQPLTSYLINGCIALDAGSLGYSLSGQELEKIEHIILSHPHLDHTASLPIAVDSAFATLKRPMQVHATQNTLRALHTHLFNNDVWIDFSEFNLAGTKTPCLKFAPFTAGETFELNGLKFTPIPVNHPVPTVGFIIESPEASIVMSSDTWKTEAIWAAAAKLPNLKAVIIECSFPDELADLAEGAGHLTPKLVWDQVSRIGRRVPVYCVHLKAAMRERILLQLAAYADRGVGVMEIGKTYSW